MTTVRSFWFGDMSPYQLLCMKSFVDYGHKYIMYAYDALEVPSGVELQDANQIAPKSSMFWYGPKAGIGRGSIAAFSNVFRYRLLQEFGGWWVDADVVCMSEKLPETDIFLGWEDDKTIGNAILKFPKHHKLMDQAVKEANDIGPNVEWGKTGPFLITTLMRQNNLLESVASPPLCYPISSANALQLLMPSFYDRLRHETKNAPLLHTWNEVLRRAVVFKWMAPPPGSFMSELFAKHDISFLQDHSYSADELQRLNDNYHAFTHWSWHQPRIEAQQSRLALVERELELLNDLYAEALAELSLRRREESPQDEMAEFANADISDPPSSALSVIDYGPESALAGQPFNPQPSGQSAIWVRTSRAPPPHTYISFDGVKLETVISDALLTAAVPAVLLMRPRTIAIKLKSEKGQLLTQPVKLIIRGN